MRPFPKPGEAEGIITLSPVMRSKKRREFFNLQRGICAECNRAMVWELGYPNSATLDHIKPQPMGHPKDDRDSNLRAICWQENYEKGSKRI